MRESGLGLRLGLRLGLGLTDTHASENSDAFASLASSCGNRKSDAATPVITPSHGEDADDAGSSCAGDDNNDRVRIMIIMVE